MSHLASPTPQRPSHDHAPLGTVVREVLVLALPAVGEQMLSMVVGVVNTFLVGHLSAAALTGVGLSSQLVMMTTALVAAVTAGSTALIARSVGAHDFQTANRVLYQSILLGGLIGLITTLLGVGFARQGLYLMGARGEALRLGTSYLSLVSATFLLATLMFVGNAGLRGAGDTRTPMRIMMLVNGINVVIAWVLINGTFGLPRLGVVGAGLGASIGRGIGGLLVIRALLHGCSGLRLRFRPWTLSPSMVKRILHVGLPSGAEQLLLRLGQISFARIVATLGTTAYAAHSVALNTESISFMPGFGFAVAATTLIGQGLGAGDDRLAERYGYISYALGAALMGIMGIVFIFFAEPLVSIFTDDAEVIALATGPLRLIGLVQPMLAAMMIFAGALRGAGDTRGPMLITGAGLWLIRVPLGALLILVLKCGLMGAWTTMSIDLTLRGLLNFLRFRNGRWKTVKV
ncbi:MAG: MATE family efflux transporter [Anaerolineae bacterium]|nr:MATE family efflux transporter [Anaerolineae bacterium]